MSLITLAVGLFLGGCNSQPDEIFFDNLEVGDQLTVAIDPLQTSVFRDKDGSITSYYIVVSKDGKVVCKASVSGLLVNEYKYTLFEIDGNSIDSLCRYIELAYKDGGEATSTTKGDAAKVERRDGVEWSNLAAEFFGWPFKTLVHEDKLEVLGLYHDDKKISNEEFVKMYKSGNLTGVFRFYGTVPTVLTCSRPTRDMTGFTPEARKRVEEADAKARKAYEGLLDSAMGADIYYKMAKRKNAQTQPASQPAKK